MNKYTIHWYRNRQATVEASNFGSEFCDINTGVYNFEDLCYKAILFEFPIDVSVNVLCNNEAVYKNTIPHEYLLKKEHHSISYNIFRETVYYNTIRVSNKGTEKNIDDLFTNIMTSSRIRFLL